MEILIVEDDHQFAKMLQIRLRHWRRDAEISHVDRIEKARNLIENKSFDLLILDQHLPDGKGADLASEPKLDKTAILAVSSDTAPELPGRSIRAGAKHFIQKNRISEALFIPLLEAIIERKAFEEKALSSKLSQTKMEAIKTLLSTLRHEINNPLGAVMGATYVLGAHGELSEDQKKALRLIEASGKRIKHVLTQLCDAAELEALSKAQEEVFHVPGDSPWGKTD